MKGVLKCINTLQKKEEQQLLGLIKVDYYQCKEKVKKNPKKKDDQVVADREEVRRPESSGERRRLKKIGADCRLFIF